MARSKEPRKICPNELATLWRLVSDHFSPIPIEVIRIAKAIWFVISAENQKAARSQLNRRFGQLRQANPELFPAVLVWLNEGPTHELFSRSGAHWARIKLIESVESIINGDSPHAAFGMNQNRGKPPLWGFTKAEDAAMYARHLHVNEKKKITMAKLDASVDIDVGVREIDRVKSPQLDAQSLRTQAELIRIKYKIK